MSPLPAGPPAPRRRSSASLFALAGLIALGTGCDFGVEGSAGGCARIVEGDYALPTKRILKASVAARLTQRGMDFITERIRALVLAFFDADASGRAIIPLSSLGLGALSTSLGPLEAQLRDLVLVIDLAGLEVRFVPGSSPPRLEVRIDDAVVGLDAGTLAGTIDAFLFTGDVACALGNGPAGRVARLDLTLEIALDTTAEGALVVRVLPSTVDLRDVALELRTDCTLPECLDGLSPPATGECFECETLCPVMDIGSALVSAVQQTFDGIVDGLLDLLADDLSNLLLDGFLNGRPLAVEGTLDLAAVFGPTLSWLEDARPLGILARPAGDAFAISGAGASLGLDVVLDAGVDAAPAHPCVGALGPDPTWEPGPRPVFVGLARAPEGHVVPYDLALGVSGALVNEALWASYKAGALCIDVTTDDLAGATAGGLVVTARALDLLLPGVTSLAGPDAPVRIRVHPDLSADPSPVRFGDGVATPLIGVSLPETRVAVDVLVGEQFLRVVDLRADLRAGLAVDVLPGARLGLRLEQVTLDRLALVEDELFVDARLDLIAPFVVELALGFLAERPITLQVGTSGLLTGLGVPIAPEVLALGPAGAAGDWLGIYLGFVAPATPTAHVRPALAFGPVEAGAVELHAAIGPMDAVQLRVAGGSWSPWFTGPGPHRLVHPRLGLLGDWPVDARLRPDGELPGPAFFAAQVHVGAAAAPAPARVAVISPERPSATSRSPSRNTAAEPGPRTGGCAAGPHGLGLAAVAGLVVLAALRRRRRRRFVLALAVLAAGASSCADARLAPARPCTHHDACDDDYLCGPEGVCVAAEACDHDGDCCPGALCFNGWCRPTLACDAVAGPPCDGLAQVCERGQCVPAPCGPDGGCDGALQCVSGRCLAGLPCEDRCDATEVCELASGRCLAAAGAPACAVGERPLVPPGVEVDPLSCHGFAWPATCVALPAVPAGRPGVDGRALALPTGPALISYEPRYGDLVLSRFDPTSSARADEALDGVPLGTAVASPESYRAGVAVAGPDRGARPALDRGRAVEGPTEVVYRDLDAGGLRYLRLAPAAAGVVASSGLPIVGDAGRWSCLGRHSTPAGDRLAGLAFVETDAGGQASALVAFEATVDPPGAPDDWVVTTVLTTPLPPREDAPCAGACGLMSVCVRPPGAADACATTATLGPSGCAGGCGPHAVCGHIGTAPAACLARVYPRYDAERTPFGSGLFVDCARGADGELVGAWYDADAGALVAGRWPWGATVRQIVDAAPGAGRGSHVRVAAAADGRVGIAYRDEGAGALRFAEAPHAGGPWATVTVHEDQAGGLDLGAWADLLYDAGGAPVIAYGEAVHGDIWVARRGATGCWGRSVVFGAGAFAWPGVLDVGGGDLVVTAHAFRFDAALRPDHGPVWARLGAPACSGR